jgi:hypothetical protein
MAKANMRSLSPFYMFVGRFVLIYGLLIIPWPGFNDAYAGYFRALSRVVFSREGQLQIVKFEPIPEGPDKKLDTKIVLANRFMLDSNGSGPARVLGLDTRGVGWMPTALLIVLVLSTPLTWRRRIRAFGLGLVAIHVFILLSVAVYIWNESDQTSGLDLVSLAPFWKTIVEGMEETLITQMGASFVVPVIVWLLVAFRQQDFTGGLFMAGSTETFPMAEINTLKNQPR